MIKGITRNQHWFTDYSYIPLTFFAPELTGFANEELPATICRVTALGVLGYSLLTDAKWGAVKLIPYRTHAAIDLATGIGTLALTAMPLARNKRVRNTFLAMGITGIIVGTLSLIGSRRS